MIDNQNVVLYRVVSKEKEQAIPIKGNMDMGLFRCIDTEEFREWVDEVLDQ